MKFWFFQVITDIFPYYNETSFEKNCNFENTLEQSSQ